MARTSYPDKSNARGIWKLKDITRNYINEGTYPGAGGDICVTYGGATDASGTGTTSIGVISISTLGNETSFGTLASGDGTGCTGFGSATRGVYGTHTPAQANIDYITFATSGNGADFGDSTSNRFGSMGASNNTRGLFMGGATPTRVNVIDFVTIATTGNATDFGNLTAATAAGGEGGHNTRALRLGGSTPSNVNVIDFVEISTTGNSVDFGDLSAARQTSGSTNSTTRSVVGGGIEPSLVNTIEYVTTNSLGNATDFGDLSATRRNLGNGLGSNSTRGVFLGGYEPTFVNTIDTITIATTGNATDFGNMLGAEADAGVASSGHGGLIQMLPRAIELYSPTGKPILSGDAGVGDVGLFMSGGYGYVTTIDYISISSIGSGVDFGDTAQKGSHMGGAGSSTRAFVAGYSGPIANNIDYGLFATKGNHADFGNLTVARDKIGSLSNNTRACFLGGRGQSSSPESLQNVIDYITMATIGNASDFGDLAATTQVAMGVANNTRGVLGGGKTPSYLNVIQYITIGSTGNASDFGDLSVARGPGGGTGVSSSTRGVYAGGEISGANSDVMDYITIASAGNATDFGDLEFVTGWASGLDNATRGVFSGFNNTSATGADTTFGNCPQISYITIASTGNYTDFGDLTARRYGLAAASNGHAALS